jgi:hypothetical protein
MPPSTITESTSSAAQRFLRIDQLSKLKNHATPLYDFRHMQLHVNTKLSKAEHSDLPSFLP